MRSDERCGRWWCGCEQRLLASGVYATRLTSFAPDVKRDEISLGSVEEEEEVRSAVIVEEEERKGSGRDGRGNSDRMGGSGSVWWRIGAWG